MLKLNTAKSSGYKTFMLLIVVSIAVGFISCTNNPKIKTTPTDTSNNSINTETNSSTPTDNTKNNVSANTINTETYNTIDVLIPGKLMERVLKGGESHKFELKLEANQYLNTIVEQKGIDVVVAVFAPNGEKIYEIDSPNGTEGNEPIYLITTTEGIYKVEVSSLSKESPDGKYEAKIVELRPAIDLDKSKVDGYRTYNEAVSLAAENKPESTQQAIEKYEKAIALFQASKEQVGEANSFNSLATLYYGIENYEKAEALFIQALDIKKKALGETHPDTAQAINYLAAFYHSTGDYSKAEPLYIQALEIKKKVLGDNNASTAETLNNFAALYYNKGDAEKAELLYTQALDIYRKVLGNNHIDTANALNNLAVLYDNEKNYEKAEPLYIQALDTFRKLLGNNHPLTATSMDNLAGIYTRKKDYEKAEALYLEATDIFRNVLGESNPFTITSINNLATFYRSKGDVEKAEVLYLQVVDISKQVLGNNNPTTATYISNLAKFYIDKGNYEKAIKYNYETNKIREGELARNLSIGSERQKQIYLQNYADETDVTLSLHTQLAPKNPIAIQSALTQVLRRKGRSIDAVNQSIEALRKRSSPEDIILLDELSKKKTELSSLTIQGLGKFPPEQYKAIINSLQEDIDKLEFTISQKSVEFRTENQAINLENVQQAVPKDSTLIEFAFYSPYDVKTKSYQAPRYVVYLLNSEGEPLWADLGEATTIDNLVDELRAKLRNGKTSINKDIKPLARKLDEVVMKPVRKLVSKDKRLLIAPDGKLNLLPFAALVDEQGKFLIENYLLSYLTSGRDLLRLKVKIESKSNPMIIGDPDFGNEITQGDVKKGSSIVLYQNFKRLPATEIEVKAVRETLKELFPKTELLVQKEATEEALAKVNAPSILHIATHGFFLEEGSNNSDENDKTRIGKILGNDSPSTSQEESLGVAVENPLLRSGIALAGANIREEGREQGIFTAYKTTALNLWGTKVVVLSACDTGVGEVKTGDGIYGLRRALVLAGSETQVMSLWPVSDNGTKELMIDYYSRLQKGEGRADALRNVQLFLLKSTNRQHPFYWASFIPSGEWANLEGKR